MKKHITSLSVLVLGFVIGASALTAIAQVVPGWNPAPANPPSGNVSAPLNTGALAQVKTGLLTLANLVFNPTGTPTVKRGDVLTAVDTSGTVMWQSPENNSGIEFVNYAAQNIFSSATRIEYDFNPVLPPNTPAILVSIDPPDDRRILFYQGNQFIGGVGGRVGGGESVNSAGGQLILPLVNNKISYLTTGSSGLFSLTILAKVPVKNAASSPLGVGSMSCTRTGDTYSFSGMPTGGTGYYTYQIFFTGKPRSIPVSRPVNVPGQYALSGSDTGFPSVTLQARENYPTSNAVASVSCPSPS